MSRKLGNCCAIFFINKKIICLYQLMSVRALFNFKVKTSLKSSALPPLTRILSRTFFKKQFRILTHSVYLEMQKLLVSSTNRHRSADARTESKSFFSAFRAQNYSKEILCQMQRQRNKRTWRNFKANRSEITYIYLPKYTYPCKSLYLILKL